MNKAVTVKKRRNYRYVIRFFAVLFAVFPFILILNTQEVSFALVGCIPFLLFIPIMLYYETWQIRLTEKEIEKSVLGKKRAYSYTQIQQVTKTFYASERNVVIRLKFLDGVAMQFRKDDENAEMAEKHLQRHCSIKTIC